MTIMPTLDDTICDANDWKIDLSDPKTILRCHIIKLLATGTKSESNVSSFLQLHGASVDKIVKELCMQG